jgi:four helix bundle protein
MRSWPPEAVMGRHYKDLAAWQKAMALVELVYVATGEFPKHEIYGLANQMRRAAVSVPSNIAEGQAHFSKRDFRHFLRASQGSLSELETQVLIAQRLKYIDQTSADTILSSINEVSRILSGLISSISLGEDS